MTEIIKEQATHIDQSTTSDETDDTWKGTRRALFKFLVSEVMLVDTAAAVLVPHRGALTKNIWERIMTLCFISNERVRHEKEQEYQISLFSPPSDPALAEKLEALLDEYLTPRIMTNNPYETIIEDWRAPHIEALTQCLQLLPMDFYLRKIGQKKLTFVCLNSSLIRSVTDQLMPQFYSPFKIPIFGIYTDYIEGNDPTIIFSSAALDQTPLRQNESLQYMVHELTHYRTDGDLDNLIERICRPISIINDQDLKRFFLTTRSDGSSEEKALNHGKLNFSEFFSVAAQLYVAKGERFVQLYAEHLGKEKALTLYDLIKDSLFRGLEFTQNKLGRVKRIQ